MVDWMLAVVISVVVAVVLISVVKKALKVALTMVVFLFVFVVVSSFLFPDMAIWEKGKDYIVGKGEGLVDQGKTKVTAYVVAEANATITTIKNTVKKEVS